MPWPRHRAAQRCLDAVPQPHAVGTQLCVRTHVTLSAGTIVTDANGNEYSAPQDVAINLQPAGYAGQASNSA